MSGKSKKVDILSKRGQNRGQINLSFGMIFSIIMIIVFIAFAFYAIGKFLNIQKAAQGAQFIDALENNVEKMWRSEQGSQELEYKLPNTVEIVCFADFSGGEMARPSTARELYSELRFSYFGEENMFFYPTGSAGGIDAVKIENINLIGITSQENPYCIQTKDGKIKLIIKKERSDGLVTVMRTG
ncbi:MAG: hypothetical protein WD876_02095 [Candidatus Pacearchaeota archaeon]